MRTNPNKQYVHGKSNYDASSTKIYDISKLNFGSLKEGANSNTYTAEFNIIDVVQKLFELRSVLRLGTINE